MNARIVLYGVCLLGALTAAACGSEDDSGISSGGAAGSSGKGSGGTGTGGTGTGGTVAGGVSGVAEAGMNGEAGGAGEAGSAGAAGTASGCTHLSSFVHGVIKNDTNEQALPTPVNGVVFCDDPPDTTAFSDLF